MSIWEKILPDEKNRPALTALEILKYIGPGLLVTVGFIDPGNWAANVAAGSLYGYSLLWMVTLSTLLLILLQHNAAHLGIVSGLCISEAATRHLPRYISLPFLVSALLACISTALAEILGGAIALNMLFSIPIKLGAALVAGFAMLMLYKNSYRYIERWIIGFVSLIGLAFVFELSMIQVDWGSAAVAWSVPVFPAGSMAIVISVLGAVVMPHNLYLHSEVIQSRQWNLEDEKVIERQLKYEFADTIFSMGIGWAINSAMMIVAAATFFASGFHVNMLEQAEATLRPLLGNTSAMIFALALLFAGFASSITAAFAGGSVCAGIFNEPYDIADRHSRIGVGVVIITAVLVIFLINDTFQGLLISQMFLSMQLPFTILLLILLTSSKKIMGRHANGKVTLVMLCLCAVLVTALNIMLLVGMLGL